MLRVLVVGLFVSLLLCDDFWIKSLESVRDRCKSRGVHPYLYLFNMGCLHSSIGTSTSIPRTEERGYPAFVWSQIYQKHVNNQDTTCYRIFFAFFLLHSLESY